MKKSRYYLGLNTVWKKREIFRAVTTPTPEDFPQFAAVVGPFTTKRGALFMLHFGVNNPHVVTVADAERLAKANTLGVDFSTLPETING